MTTTTKTQPLTATQAQVLNQLSRASANLRGHLVDIKKRCDEQLERATEGFHMSGFEGDLLGQSRYQADAEAVKRAALITASHASGASHEAIVVALRPTTQRRMMSNGEHSFHEGDTFDIDPALHQ